MLSKEKLQEVKGEILGMLYQHYPESFFTNAIAKHVERDEELVKRLLLELQERRLVNLEFKSEAPVSRKRMQWRMTKAAKATYDQKRKAGGEK